MDLSPEVRRRAYESWLRTGHWPTVRTTDGLEHKFNPWHDPANGRFTFAGAGRQGSDRQRSSRTMPRASTETAMSAHQTDHPNRAKTRKTASRHPVTEFAAGVGEGVSIVAKDTVAGLHAALTTNPKTTIHNSLTGIAEKIDAAIAAEDTPARVQVRRAAQAIAHASPRELGRATGSTITTTALILAPEAAAAKISTLRAIRRANLRPQYKPPEFRWVKENVRSNKPWKIYNDAAPGAQIGKAPALDRPMPNRSFRPVKFDGIEHGYPIDRKWSIVPSPKARAQILRQSAALRHNGVHGIWEIPNEFQKRAAFKILKELRVTNIKVRVVEP